MLSEGRSWGGLVCLDGTEGDANRSSASDESERPALPVSGIAMLVRVNVRSVATLKYALVGRNAQLQLHHHHTRLASPDLNNLSPYRNG